MTLVGREWTHEEQKFSVRSLLFFFYIRPLSLSILFPSCSFDPSFHLPRIIRLSLTMHEIVTLQFGHFSNFVGAHFWNTQVRKIPSFSYPLLFGSDINLHVAKYGGKFCFCEYRKRTSTTSNKEMRKRLPQSWSTMIASTGSE